MHLLALLAASKYLCTRFQKAKSMDKTTILSEVPQGWALCFNSQCAVSGSCLRREMARRAVMAPTAMCVTPAALSGDGTCTQYVSSQTVDMARGFDRAYASLRSRDARYEVRRLLTAHFGSRGSYYRAKHGQLALTPAQQQPVSQVFRQHGFAGADVFDEHFSGYLFCPEPAADAPQHWSPAYRRQG